MMCQLFDYIVTNLRLPNKVGNVLHANYMVFIKSIVNLKDYLYENEFDLRTDSRVYVILLPAKMNQVKEDCSVSSPAYIFSLYLSKFSFRIEHQWRKESLLLTELLSSLNLETVNKYWNLVKI